VEEATSAVLTYTLSPTRSNLGRASSADQEVLGGAMGRAGGVFPTVGVL
jgi:hypothetical protein